MSSSIGDDARAARSICVLGIVQGVGFRPHVWRLARAHGVHGWVLNAPSGVHIHAEGPQAALDGFVRALRNGAPPAADVTRIDIAPDRIQGFTSFEIRSSESDERPTTRIAPDLPICQLCLAELFDESDRRYRYPYINCTECGPRFSIIRALPYDRPLTTMAGFPLCRACDDEYRDPGNRRFHAQPVACPQCGPHYRLLDAGGEPLAVGDPFDVAARRLSDGAILAVKGIGGYHLACDARNPGAVTALRERKYRKEQAFALMARDLATAAQTVDLSAAARALLISPARPIVLAPAKTSLEGVAPDNTDFGVILPYAPVHHLLFAAAAPDLLVMTSGNRSSEPIAYRDEEALGQLSGLADAFLAGNRPIARRVDDSVVRDTAFGPMVLRRSRGLSPAAAATFPVDKPVLALGADLKNTVTLAVAGQAYVSQHVGDLSHAGARVAFHETVHDLLDMYAVDPDGLTVVHDRHPEYVSTAYATTIGAAHVRAVQHHRAHVASVLAERGAFDRPVVGVAFDGTGYGDDGAIWGGEFFAGSIEGGFDRVGHVRPARLAGGDAASRHPVQAAAGFLAELNLTIDVTQSPFYFPERYEQACAILRSGVRVFETTSAGRLFDTVAALVGFTRPVTFEGQASIWLEHLAREAAGDALQFTCPFSAGQIDWRETLDQVVNARRRGERPETIARAFHLGFARAVAAAGVALAEAPKADTIVLSGGVMQNQLLLADIRDALASTRVAVWTNQKVPPNDGGLSLGQAALALVTDGRSEAEDEPTPERSRRGEATKIPE